jgi:hypothetical protein
MQISQHVAQAVCEPRRVQIQDRPLNPKVGFLLHSSLQPAEVFRIVVDHYQIVKEL